MPLAAVAASGLDRCVNAALHGPEVKRVFILGHHWNCKPVQTTMIAKDATSVIGQLSHNVRGSPDDQVYYGYALENGVLKPDSLKIRIKEGGWGNVAGVVGSAVGAYLGVPIPPDAGKKFWRQASKVVGGKGWPDVAPLLITSIAVYHASAVQRSLRIRDHRSHKSN